MRENLKLTIDGMHCGACVRRVTQVLNSLPGVETCEVNIGSAYISYEPEKASPPDIAAALERGGFRAVVAGGHEDRPAGGG